MTDVKLEENEESTGEICSIENENAGVANLK
jgi:hypothetical protein